MVDEATALIEAQSFEEAGSMPLPADLGVLSARIASGTLGVDLVSGLPIDCDVILHFPELTTAEGSALDIPLTLPADGTTTARVDLADAVVAAPGGTPLDALHWTLSIASEGSGGVPVTIAAGDRISAALLPTTLAFAEVTGTVPEEVYVIEPVSESIDLPDELDGLHLQAASLTIEIVNETGIGGELDLQLSGVSADGTVTTVSAIAHIAANLDKSARTTIVLDQDNSNIADLLSELPESFVFEGEVRIGGPDEVGSVRPGDGATVSWRLDAPLRLIVDQTEFDQEPTALNLDVDTRRTLDENLVSAQIRADIVNHFPFGVEVRLLVGATAATTLTSPTLEIGPFAVTAGEVDTEQRWVIAPGESSHIIPLTQAQIGAFTAPGACVAVVALIPGTDGEEVLVRIGDRLSLAGALSVEVIVEDDNGAGGTS